jgi:N-acetylglutamate synthase-like GNAT family acetyltransferase
MGAALNLVDLNGRQDDPDVLRVLRYSHGSEKALEEARAHYRSGEWLFLGWQDGDEILGCAGAENFDDETIGIRSIAVVPNWRHRGLAHGLIDALAERMDAERVVAETDDDADGFYRRCGFAVEDASPKFGRPRYWCLRDAAQ